MKARSQDNPDYPDRQPVPDEAVRWHNPFPEPYNPPEWTHDVVYANASDMPTGHKWADPSDATAMRQEIEQRTTFATEGGKGRTFAEALAFDASGRPLNPVGRTGMTGRGLLGKWGSNHAADPIVTRFDPATGHLQVVAIQRKDTGQWAIPGGMVVSYKPATCVTHFTHATHAPPSPCLSVFGGTPACLAFMPRVVRMRGDQVMCAACDACGRACRTRARPCP